MNDPSDFVRQSLCEKMKFLPKKIIHKLLEDPSPPVRAMALLKMNQELSFEERCSLLKLRIEKEEDDYVLKIALKCCGWI
jgi:HEAT repeat protein